MKTFQLLGLLLALLGLALGYWILGGLDADTTSSAGGGAFFALMFFSLPCFVISAIILIPSSIELLSKSTRKSQQFTSLPYKLLLSVNVLISCFYTYLVLYFSYLFVKATLH